MTEYLRFRVVPPENDALRQYRMNIASEFARARGDAPIDDYDDDDDD